MKYDIMVRTCQGEEYILRVFSNVKACEDKNIRSYMEMVWAELSASRTFIMTECNKVLTISNIACVYPKSKIE